MVIRSPTKQYSFRSIRQAAVAHIHVYACLRAYTVLSGVIVCAVPIAVPLRRFCAACSKQDWTTLFSRPWSSAPQVHFAASDLDAWNSNISCCGVYANMSCEQPRRACHLQPHETRTSFGTVPMTSSAAPLMLRQPLAVLLDCAGPSAVS